MLFLSRLVARKEKKKQLLDLLARVSWRDYYWWIVGSVTIDSGAVRSCWERAAIQWILQAPLFMCLHSRLLFLNSVFVGYECRDVDYSVLCTGFSNWSAACVNSEVLYKFINSSLQGYKIRNCKLGETSYRRSWYRSSLLIKLDFSLKLNARLARINATKFVSLWK